MSFIIAFVLIATAAIAQNADAVVGFWHTKEGKAKVEIYKQDNMYYGKIVWLKEPNENGKPKVDKENSDKNLRSKPLIGLLILKNFVYDEDNVWNDGEIYDPKNGKTYSCKMTLVSPNQLDIRGYIGISLFGRTETWTRTSQ